MNIAIILLYLLTQIVISYFISKRINNEEDYLVGGRSVPFIFITMSLFATWFGAETCIGSSGAVYAEGISGSRADPFGYSLCLVLSGLFITKKIWNKNYFTLGDFYKDRYGPTVEKVASGILCFSSLIWGAAQMRAFGQVLAQVSDLPIIPMMFCALLFVLVYCLFGGLLGDIASDFIQGIVIVLGLGLLLWTISSTEPQFMYHLTHQSAQRLSFLGQGENMWMRLDRFAIPVLGSLVSQEIISRILSAKNATIAQRASYTSAFIYIIVGAIPVIIGLVGPALFTWTGHRDEFLIKIAEHYMPALTFPLFAGAIIAALLATIDSILLGSAGLLGHNFLIPALKIKNEKRKLLLTRVLVILSGLFCFSLAVLADNIYELLEAASSFGTSGILIITLLGLWARFGTARGAFMSLVVGSISTISFKSFHVQAPFLMSVALSGLTYILFSLGNKTRSVTAP